MQRPSCVPSEPTHQEAVWWEVAEAHQQFKGPHRCDVPYELLLAVGAK